MNEKLKADLAPIVLFVYNRPLHTARTLNALQNNDLAPESVLYVFCDGPKENATEESLKKIEKVRGIVREKRWCNEVIVIESEKNKGLATSIKSGVSEVIKKHGRVIVMEDDLVTSPAFLTYMNNALNYYQERKAVFSISGCGLSPEIIRIPGDYQYDVFVCLRNSSWGWATWEDRWYQIDWEVKAFETISQNISIKEAFNRGGDDVFDLLLAQKTGKLDIWSIQFTLAHFVNHAVSIVPVLSFVDNVGLDGSGVHCGVNETLRNKSLNRNRNVRFIDILYEDKRIINSYYSAFCRKKRPLWKKIINRVSRFLSGKSVFIVKKKIYC